MFAQSLKRGTYIVVAIIIGLLAYNLGATKTRIPLRARQFTTHAPQPDGLVLPYHASVAFKPKNRDDNRLMRKHLKAAQVESPSGEDNYFVTTHGQQLACGVADGVGGWAELGYDSSAISRELCNAMSEAFNKNTETPSPRALLDFAFDKIQKDGKVKVGGTTACLGIFDSHTLRVANLGDSWCGVFRDYKLIAETKVQTHGFNTPYQLAIIPQEIKDENKGSRFIMDRPSDADEYEFEVAKDDIVIFATDGVIDNIDVKDIEIYLRDNEGVPLEKLSRDFVQNVYKLSKDEDFPSVFSQELSKLTGQFYSGGKEDDITVVMVKVQ
jgi:protein phosphatase PTC7